MLPVILNVPVSHQKFPAGKRNFSVSNFTGILLCFLSLLLLYYYWAMQLSRGLVSSESSQRYSGDSSTQNMAHSVFTVGKKHLIVVQMS